MFVITVNRKGSSPAKGDLCRVGDVFRNRDRPIEVRIRLDKNGFNTVKILYCVNKLK